MSASQAGFTVITDVENSGRKGVRGVLKTEVVAPDGLVVASDISPLRLKEGESSTVEQSMNFKNPLLWSVKAPNLYKVVSRIEIDGQTVDEYNTVTGFRNLEFDAEKGFSLNGERMKINGVCLHHDAGALGAVVNRAAIARQLSILKEMGVNAVRSSHNPPAPELLELCDSMGVMVMDETFDMWRKKRLLMIMPVISLNGMSATSATLWCATVITRRL